MAIPTITSITPTRGPTVGDFVVAIEGTGFHVATSTPAQSQLDGNPNGAVKPTAVVMVGGVPCTNVQVFDSTFLTAIVPPHTIAQPPNDGTAANNSEAVDVVVQNYDPDAEQPIAGEIVTLTRGFTYVMPVLTAEAESDLSRVVRTLIRVLKRGLLIPEVTYAVSADYDPATGDELHVTKFGNYPAISIIGPELVENRFYSVNEQPTYDDTTSSPPDDDGNPTAFVETRAPYTVDLMFTMIGASNNKMELLNLMAAFTLFMHKTKFLYMDKSASDPSKGQVKYEFDFVTGQQPKANLGTDRGSNLYTFATEVIVRGFDIESFTGLEDGDTSDVPDNAIVSRGKAGADMVLDSEVQLGLNLRPGPSPG